MSSAIATAILCAFRSVRKHVAEAAVQNPLHVERGNKSDACKKEWPGPVAACAGGGKTWRQHVTYGQWAHGDNHVHSLSMSGADPIAGCLLDVAERVPCWRLALASIGEASRKITEQLLVCICLHEAGFVLVRRVRRPWRRAGL